MDTVKQIVEKIRRAIAANPKAELHMPGHLANRIKAELKRQAEARARAGIAKDRLDAAAGQIEMPHAQARNARRRARARGARRLEELNRGGLTPPTATPRASWMDEPIGPPAVTRCARAVCQAEDARWWNSSTRRYYCAACADGINAHAPGLCVEHAVKPTETLGLEA